jgi:hypothetical protein
MRPIELIVIHAAATPENMDIGVAEIREWHIDRGMRDIGYHDVIRRNGLIEKGRNIERAGAHAKGYNSHSIGICLVGGVDVDDISEAEFNFTRPQMASLNKLLDLYKIEFPDAEVVGHKDLPGVTKACPCFDVKSYTTYERRTR